MPCLWHQQIIHLRSPQITILYKKIVQSLSWNWPAGCTGWLSHFPLQLIRQWRKIHPDFLHSPAAAQLAHLALLSAHLKPVDFQRNKHSKSKLKVKIRKVLGQSTFPFSNEIKTSIPSKLYDSMVSVLLNWHLSLTSRLSTGLDKPPSSFNPKSYFRVAGLRWLKATGIWRNWILAHGTSIKIGCFDC